MASHAETVADVIRGREWEAYTLYGGYGFSGGVKVVFPGGLEVKNRRNEKGRTTYSLYEYRDGSRLEFTHSEARGSRVKVVRKAKV